MIPLWLFYLLGFCIASCSFIAGFILCAIFRIVLASDASVDDYVLWSKIPAGYDWVAIDNHTPYDSHLFMFEEKPYIDESLGNDASCWLWRDDSKYEQVPIDSIIGPLPPWRESLRRRPK